MAKTQHTRGPWDAVTKTTFNGEDATEISSGDDTVAICTNYSAADAALIAASPDLLKALRRIEFALSLRAKTVRNHEGYPLVEIARAAIAKAGGAA